MKRWYQLSMLQLLVAMGTIAALLALNLSQQREFYYTNMDSDTSTED